MRLSWYIGALYFLEPAVVMHRASQLASKFDLKERVPHPAVSLPLALAFLSSYTHKYTFRSIMISETPKSMPLHLILLVVDSYYVVSRHVYVIPPILIVFLRLQHVFGILLVDNTILQGTCHQH